MFLYVENYHNGHGMHCFLRHQTIFSVWVSTIPLVSSLGTWEKHGAVESAIKQQGYFLCDF